jgi:hypothetical protein
MVDLLVSVAMFKRIRHWWRHKSNGAQGLVVIFVLCTLPHLVILISGKHESLGRIVAAGFAFVGGSIVIIWWGLSPNSRIIRRRAKLNRLEYDTTRPIAERLIRLAIVILGIGFAWAFALPFLIDVTKMTQGEKPEMVTGRVTVTRGRYHIWFLWDLFTVENREQRIRDVSLLYAWHPIKNGTLYDVTILPRSKVVLQAIPISE